MKKKKREPIMFLDDIIECVERIEEYTKKMTESEFASDEMTKDAVMRRIGIIGEAVKNLPASIRNNHKEIDWKKIAGMRDVLVHEYFGVASQRVWGAVKKDVPDLKVKISKILKDFKISKLV